MGWDQPAEMKPAGRTLNMFTTSLFWLPGVKVETLLLSNVLFSVVLWSQGSRACFILRFMSSCWPEDTQHHDDITCFRRAFHDETKQQSGHFPKAVQRLSLKTNFLSRGRLTRNVRSTWSPWQLNLARAWKACGEETHLCVMETGNEEINLFAVPLTAIPPPEMFL